MVGTLTSSEFRNRTNRMKPSQVRLPWKRRLREHNRTKLVLCIPSDHHKKASSPRDQFRNKKNTYSSFLISNMRRFPANFRWGTATAGKLFDCALFDDCCCSRLRLTFVCCPFQRTKLKAPLVSMVVARASGTLFRKFQAKSMVDTPEMSRAIIIVGSRKMSVF